MKRSERGFTLIELLIVMAIVALIAGAAGAATMQLFASTKRSNDHMTAVRQVQNAGYWISRDAMMAENVVVDNLTPSNFLVLNWAEWDYAGDSTYHSVTYSIEDPSPDGIRKLKRQYLIYIYDDDDDEWEEIGNTMTLVAKYIYYTGESDTTWASYTPPVLTVQIAASIGEASEIKEYRIWHRPNF